MNKSPEKKAWFTAAELAEMRLPGISLDVSAIIKRAKKGHWESRKHEGRGGGREYSVNSLPKLTRRALLTQLEAPSQEGLPKITQKEISELRPMQREEAEKRINIIQEWNIIKKDVPQKEQTKALKTYCENHGTALRTFYNWIALYKQGGYRALIPYAFTGVKRAKITKEMAAYIKKKILIPDPPPTKVLCEQFYKAFHDKTDPAQMPTERTIYNFISGFCPQSIKHLIQKPEAYDNKFNPYVRRDWDSCELNEVWIADSKQIDIACLYKGRAIFPWIAAILEAKSRKFISWLLVAKVDALVIGQVVGYALSKYGPSKTLYCDHGKDYKSHYIAGSKKKFNENIPLDGLNDSMVTGILRDMGIEIFLSAPFNGREKIIEANFGIFTDRLRGLPGYRGHNTKTRPKKVDREIKSGKILSFNELSQKIDELLTERNARPHSTTGKAPDSYWENYQAITPSQSALDFLLMDRHYVRVRDASVRIEGQLYRHEDLIRLAGSMVECRRDPRDVRRAVILFQGRVFCAAAHERAATFRDPITLETIKNNALIRKRTNGFRKHIIANSDVIEDLLYVEVPTIEDAAMKQRRRDIRPAPSKVISLHRHEKNALDAKKALQKSSNNNEPQTAKIEIFDRLLAANGGNLSKNDYVDEY